MKRLLLFLVGILVGTALAGDVIPNFSPARVAGQTPISGINGVTWEWPQTNFPSSAITNAAWVTNNDTRLLNLTGALVRVSAAMTVAGRGTNIIFAGKSDNTLEALTLLPFDTVAALKIVKEANNLGLVTFGSTNSIDFYMGQSGTDWIVTDSGFNQLLTVSSAGVISGNGLGLTNLNASALASGTVPNARLASNTAFANAVPVATSATTMAWTNDLNLDEVVATTVNATIVYGNLWPSTNYQSTNIINNFKAAFYTNYTVLRTDQILACAGTNQLLTLPDGTNGVPRGSIWTFLMSSTTGYGSAIVTNANGVQTVLTATALSQTITNGQSLTLIWDGANWR